jgi:hypothetical protein
LVFVRQLFAMFSLIYHTQLRTHPSKTKETTSFIPFQSEKAISSEMMAVIRVAVLNLFRRRIDSPTRQQQPPSRFSSPAIYFKKAFVYSSKGFDDWEAEIALVCVQLHLTYVKCEFDTL